jgi:hypothetical protein
MLAAPFRTDAPAMKITRSDAERTAREALSMQGILLDGPWKALSFVQGQPGEINRFVWQTAGRDRYEKLLGVYVTPPSWVVRFARFQGDVAERAEEYHVYIDGSGRVFRVSHGLPEAASGKSLSANEARSKALVTLHDTTTDQSPNGSDSPLQNFEEVSNKPEKHPSRTDWTFVFKDKRDYGLTRGEPRVSIEIAGDKVVDAFRWVYVPEDWTRNEQARQNVPGILSALCTIIVVALVVAAAVIGVVHWSRRRPFSSRTFFAVFGFVFLFSVVNVFNSWPQLASQASTAQPFELQVGILLVVSMVSRIFMAIGLGLVAGLFAGSIKVPATTTLARCLLYGVSTGLVLAATIAAARRAVPLMSPLWGNLDAAPTFIPFVGAMIGPLGGFFAQTMILLAVLYGLRHRSQAGALWIIVGIAIAGMSPIETVVSWLIVGVTTGLVLMIAYNLIFRHQPQLALIAVATMVILSMIREAVQHMFPAALIGSMAGAVLVAIAAWLWFRGSIGETG